MIGTVRKEAERVLAIQKNFIGTVPQKDRKEQKAYYEGLKEMFDLILRNETIARRNAKTKSKNFIETIDNSKETA